jgi:hypothetical protein
MDLVDDVCVFVVETAGITDGSSKFTVVVVQSTTAPGTRGLRVEYIQVEFFVFPHADHSAQDPT